MKTLCDELREYHLTDAEINRILATLNSGKTVRTTYTPEIDSIYLNDESTITIVVVDSNGNEKEIERGW